MKRRFLLKSAGFTAMGCGLFSSAFGRDDGKVGKLAPAAFKKSNTEAGEKVRALLGTAAPLSPSDQNLLEELALGGLVQLLASELAVENARSTEVKLYAEGEVEEQNILAAKLAELAAQKSTKLPTDPGKKGAKILEELKAKGDGFDRLYLEMTGVRGHEELKNTMTKVRLEATDPLLKSLATVMLPLVDMHLRVARDEVATME